MFALLIGAPSAIGLAQYPQHPIDLVVGYELGALTDLQCRIMMSVGWEPQYLGRRVNIVNRRTRLRGRTDWSWCKPLERCQEGYTLMAYKLPHCLARAIVFQTGTDTSACTPIVNWSREPAALIVPQNSPFKNFTDLMAYAGEHPGKLTVSGAGLYVGHHIAFLQLAHATGTSMTYIPEKSGMAALQSTMQNIVKAGFNDLSTALRNEGRVRILAIADLSRQPAAPHIPTFQEKGVAVDDLSACYRGITFPPEVLAEARQVMLKKMPVMARDLRLSEAFESLRIPLHIMTGAEVRLLFQDRQQRLKKLLQDLRHGIQQKVTEQ